MKNLENKIKKCNKCQILFDNRAVNPSTLNEKLKVRPIFDGSQRAPIMLIGQAPGIHEYLSGKAFQGQAGHDIRQIFEVVGVDSKNFDKFIYQTSVTKCFPGRKCRKDNGKEEDIQPTKREIDNCIPYLQEQIDLLKPKIILLLGKCAIEGYLRLKGIKYSATLENYVGKKEIWDESVVIFFPHTSGTSRWLNKPENCRLFDKAKKLLRKEIIDCKILP